MAERERAPAGQATKTPLNSLQSGMANRPPLSGKILITGAAGFIGGNFSRFLADRHPAVELLLLDKLSAYSSMGPIQELIDTGRAHFIRLDLSDTDSVYDLISSEQPDFTVNFAAESHNDRAILDSRPFVYSNVVGAFNLLEATRLHNPTGRLVHISTIEVYGEQAATVPFFTEASPLNAKTPYSASKAAADLLVRSHMQTYPHLDLAMTHCANNYGPWQFPEKLIPLAITNIMRGRRVPLYGDGEQKRDWLHVLDHCRGIELVLARPRTDVKAEAATDPSLLPIFDFSAREELSNRTIIRMVTDALGVDFYEWTETVPDRPNHDRRYLIEPLKAEQQLGFAPQVPLSTGIVETVHWYRDNSWWWQDILERGELQFDWSSVHGS